MRKGLIVLALALPGLALTNRSALAWGTAAHAYIARAIADDFVPGPRIYRPYMECQFAYGAMAPDLAWVAPQPVQDPLAQATHREPGYDDVFDVGQPDRAALVAFSLGWLTHNEAWGADLFAHDPSVGYVVQKASALAWSAGIPEGLAHDYIEIAIDLLIDHECDPGIGEYLRRSAIARDWRIPGLLVSAYPAFDSAVLEDSERAFKRSAVAYGAGLALPSPWDEDVAALGLALHAQSAYGLNLSFAQSKALLIAAANLVRDDYFPALQSTTEQARLGLWAWLAAH
jgi:hypothetical protein